MKSFNEFLNENLHDAAVDKLSDTRDALKEDLLNAIESSMNSSDLIDLQNWIGKFEEGDPNTVIDSLTDDSNVYDFYLKHQDDIDAVLSANNWFDNKMSTLNISSLYEAIVEGTKQGIKFTIEEIKNELF